VKILRNNEPASYTMIHDQLTRPNLTIGQPEWREYRARYWDNTPVGDWSAVVRAMWGRVVRR
jgi:hypothetical protein